MLRRFLGLRQRYLNQALHLTGQPGLIRDAEGRTVGRIDAIAWAGQRLTVSGHAGPGRLHLQAGRIALKRHLPAAETAFHFETPWPASDLAAGPAPVLRYEDGPEVPLRLSGLRWQRAYYTAEFCWRVVLLLPLLCRWLIRRDPDSKARIKTRLRLTAGEVPAGPIPATLFAAPPTPTKQAAAPSPVVLVLPVYNAAELTRECLDRIARHTDLDWRLIAVEDGSTDPGVRPMLRNWAATRPAGQVTVIEHDTNQGFIVSVNAAFDTLRADPALRDRPVILLNTDALVPPGWASRLVAPLLADPDVASVTPMSNDAEIFTVPSICARQDLRPKQADAIDRTAARLDPATALVPAPTGVGFCMALSAAFLARVPWFDTAFGQGYGEEVDWCQKVRAMGGRHLGSAALFVEHRGGASFGTDKKAALLARNGEIVSRRYPGYDAEVQDFLTVDPMRGPRVALALAWAGSVRPGAQVPIYLAHALGGGAEHWLRARIAEDLAAGDRPSVVLRVGGPARWQLEVWSAGGVTAGWTDDLDLVEALLDPIGQRRIVYSCGVGDSDPVTLPDVLRGLARGPEDRIEVLFHDFLPLAPSMTLLDGQGRYHGPITPDRLAALPPGTADAFATLRPDGQRIDLATWQDRWGALLRDAAAIRVFSASSAGIVAKVWPDLADRIEVTPHRPAVSYGAVAPPADTRPPVLAILGNIAPHKGARLVQVLAEMTEAERGGAMVLIGDIDPAFALPKSCRVHGRYEPADIPALIRHYGITHWLIPSLWPETFSFTTHEALQTGLPVMAFGLGAQGDAVRAAKNGVCLPYTPDADEPALAAHILSAFAVKAVQPRG
ncbi:glycosyltransferase [Roseovarius aestuariivivens]|uniref:glycosyltransferase n=1 Tax=Roseovarius aestuariivivens TaxID=1888910 RepID=UPI0010816737|nr:glycosyltransferase [Roseovarius aestuariivivens]